MWARREVPSLAGWEWMLKPLEARSMSVLIFVAELRG